ncbi:hypothetical protein EV132_10415 [Rhizobium sullae]|uniref:Uncharacterized protein n=1 Tax=Rhizobium sullae TaxID=50338 RepID=A0A4R3Q6T0_RHISU|nr:hypothetical protein EV132_10415 [Rhizobium sullae]
MRYLHWLQEQQFDHSAHQIALQEMVEAGAGDQNISHCSELAPRAWAEAGQRQGNILQTLCDR